MPFLPSALLTQIRGGECFDQAFDDTYMTQAKRRFTATEMWEYIS